MHIYNYTTTCTESQYTFTPALIRLHLHRYVYTRRQNELAIGPSTLWKGTESPTILTSIRTLNDFRKCKSVIDDVNELIEEIRKVPYIKLPNVVIPAPILALRAFLPGTSTERETINAIQFLQDVGIPTEPLPDGSPNKMIQFASAVLKGKAKENAESGRTDVTINPTDPTKGVGLSY